MLVLSESCLAGRENNIYRSWGLNYHWLLVVENGHNPNGKWFMHAI